MFKTIQEFEIFAREYSDDAVRYELGNCLDCIDFYANIILRKSGELLSFTIEFDDGIDVIESNHDIYETYINEYYNEQEAIDELSPAEVFEKFPNKIEILKP